MEKHFVHWEERSNIKWLVTAGLGLESGQCRRMGLTAFKLHTQSVGQRAPQPSRVESSPDFKFTASLANTH